jgi:hypothetical protein
MSGTNSFWPFLKSLATLGVALPALAAAHQHDDDHALTVFVSAEQVEREQAPVGAQGMQENSSLLADFLIGVRHERFRVLGEFVLGNDDHEFERLQLGYETSDSSMLWLGRYHQPASVWNVVYHHGQFVQTSITRPWMENWEDKGGALPQHNVGFLYETEFAGRGENLWRLSTSFGLAPTLKPHSLEDIAPFTGTYRGAGTTTSARLEWLPHAVGEDSLGLVVSRSQINADARPTGARTRLGMDMLGGFLTMHRDRVRALAVVYLMDFRDANSDTTPVREQHLAGYAQLDFEFSEYLTLYGRQEDSSARRSAYLSQFPMAAARRTLAGARYQIGHWNALSLEVSRRTPFNGNTFGEVRAQWSAVIP